MHRFIVKGVLAVVAIAAVRAMPAAGTRRTERPDPVRPIRPAAGRPGDLHRKPGREPRGQVLPLPVECPRWSPDGSEVATSAPAGRRDDDLNPDNGTFRP